MIPKFPEFKKLELSDKEEIEKYTKNYSLYSSDFNFTSLWVWNTNNECIISELSGNLIVRFTDYGTNELFFSFIGINDLERTAFKLIQYAKDSDISPVLRLVPEVSVAEMPATTLVVEEDRDNFDYIFSVAELASFQGLKFKEKRHLANRFLREYPEARFELIDLSDTDAQIKIASLLRTWEDNKKSEYKKYELQNEETAITRLLQTADVHKLVASSISLNNRFIGFSISEILPCQYGISHFAKADSTYDGVYEFMNMREGQYLLTHNVVLWNWEQDLGIESLRESKMGYRPINFLKKYTISLPDKH